MGIVEQILDLARWAPSGDNTQPWRFEISGIDRMVVHGFDTRDHCVYDLDGRASQISIGALLETIRIAATGFGLRTRIARRPDAPESRPVFDVMFDADTTLSPSDLIPSIRVRSVQRRAMRTRAIVPLEKLALSASLPPGYSIHWLEGRARWQMARLLFASAKIRLTTREAFEVHSKVIEWRAQFSNDRIPDQSVGLDPFMTRVMAWAMHDWRRVWVLNTFFAGTLGPRFQLDFAPAVACGAHVLLIAPEAPAGLDDFVAAGAAVQRFWLTATRLGLQHQPEMTPLIFARYVREGRQFTTSERAIRRAGNVSRRLESTVGLDALRQAVWLGRIGAGNPASSRSLRRSLAELMAGGFDRPVLPEA